MKKCVFAQILGLTVLITFLAMPSTADAFTLRNYRTGLCVGAAGGNANPGTNFVTWTCSQTNQDKSQWFGQIEVSCPAISPCNFLDCDLSDWYYCSYLDYGTPYENFQGGGSIILYDSLTSVGCDGLRDPGEGTHCGSFTTLSIEHDAISNGSRVVQEHNSNNFDQRWLPMYVGTDFSGHACYYFENIASMLTGQTYVLSVLGGNTKPGGQVVIWQLFKDANSDPDYQGHPDQYWCVY